MLGALSSSSSFDFFSAMANRALSAPDASTPSRSVPAEPSERTAVESSSMDFRRTQKNRSSFELDLTTQDGDRVTLRFDAKSASRERLKADDDSISFRQVDRSSAKFKLEIEGNLDADERAAVASVVVAAADLADDFFAGDTDLEVADLLATGVANSDDIASFSLDASQRSKVRERYKEFDDGARRLRSVTRDSQSLSVRFDALGEGVRGLVDDASRQFNATDATRLVAQSLSFAIGVNAGQAVAAPAPAAVVKDDAGAVVATRDADDNAGSVATTSGTPPALAEVSTANADDASDAEQVGARVATESDAQVGEGRGSDSTSTGIRLSFSESQSLRQSFFQRASVSDNGDVSLFQKMRSSSTYEARLSILA